MHPVQPALNLEPGLIESRDIACGDVPADPFQEPVQLPGGRAVMPATVPGDNGMPNNSASAPII